LQAAALLKLKKNAMDAHAKKWIATAMRTGRGDRSKIEQAVYGIYEAAGLKYPRVVIVPSPLVMAFAGDAWKTD
jgi:hypothetical protein